MHAGLHPPAPSRLPAPLRRRLHCCVLSLLSAARALAPSGSDDVARLEKELEPFETPGEESALQRGRALALRSCANLRCPRPQGGSEREAFERGRRCSKGCGLRFCSESCNKAAWRELHRPVCAALAAEKGMGA